MFRVGPCFPWRWLHRRQRRIDIAVMWPEIVRAAYAKTAVTRDAEARITAAWRAFQDQRGQEHWHCDCAHDDEAVANLKREPKPHHV